MGATCRCGIEVVAYSHLSQTNQDAYLLATLLGHPKTTGNATGPRQRLRSFDEIHVADDGVKKQVRIYMRSRSALAALFDPDDIPAQVELKLLLEKYRVIQREDLKAETALIESYMSGQRDKHASWLWYFEDTVGGDSGVFLENSKSLIYIPIASH